MISFDFILQREMGRSLRKRIDDGLFRSIGHAAAAIRATARRLIVKSGKHDPAPAGQPVHTREGLAKRSDAILYDVDRRADDALIGFTYHALGESMEVHERGGTYRGGLFPARPTMGPALDLNLVRFADEFRGVLGEF